MYKKFCNLYSLSKTLRFELKPDEKTAEYIRERQLLEDDKQRDEDTKLAKRVLDGAHRLFINDVLENVRFDQAALEKYASLSLRKLSSQEQKSKESARRTLYANIKKAIEDASENWKEKYEIKKSFLQSANEQLTYIEEMKEAVAKQSDTEANEVEYTLERFKGFSTYFTGFSKNRENMYATSEEKSTSIAYRCVNQNLIKFYRNIERFNKFYSDELSDSANLFRLESYTGHLTQTSIELYNLGVGELNKIINEKRQTADKDERKAMPLFEILFKQILGDNKDKVEFEQIENESEFNDLVAQLQKKIPRWRDQIRQHMKQYVVNPINLEGIYINKKTVNSLIQNHISDRELVTRLLPEDFTKRFSKKNVDPKTQFVSLSDFFGAIDGAQSELDEGISITKSEKPLNDSAAEYVWGRFVEYLETLVAANFDGVDAIEDFTHIKDFGDKDNKNRIKRALDAFKDLYGAYTGFELRYGKTAVSDLDFDQDFYKLFADSGEAEDLFDIDDNKRPSHYYDLIRNYLTKKPYSLDKWKLNFNCSTLLGGWDINKEKDNYGALFKTKDAYYLGVVDHKKPRILEQKITPELYKVDTNDWQKMEYKLLPGANKMLPKCLLPNKDPYKYGATQEILRIRENKTYIKSSDDFSLHDVHKLIDFYKSAIRKYTDWSMYEFEFKNTEEYNSINEFYRDVDRPSYKLEFRDINYVALRKLVDEGKIYLFRIQNKDLVRNNLDRRPNIHTIYFRSLFMQNTNTKLCGEAEIFFRPKSIKSVKSSHRKTPDGSNIIKSRRFTEDKTMLNVPIAINRVPRNELMFSNNSIFNRYTCDIIKKHGIKVAIGIDRGEKHLAYVTIVDINGKLLEEPISLNKIINSKGFTTDYLKLLSDCEQERLENRQNWDAVRRIKDLKEGYVSHCVKFIVDKMIEHEAIVVLENLNIGFKQGRSKIERNVYNQLENALLSKLQYIVDKTKLADEPFGIKNGVQLTPADIAPGDVRMSGNQMGFVFYVDPSYTSAVDPVTGYRQQMRLNEKIKCSNFATFISSAFNDIKYNKGDVIFTFSWEKLAKTVNNLSKDKYINDDLKKDLISSKVWTITANVDRVVWDKNANGGRGQNKKLNVQKELELLFEEYNIKLDRDLKTQISKANFSSKDVKRFCYLFNLINKIRNSADDRDDIISPVIGGLDSRKDKFQGFEWNGDANGAYNIARKGAILLNRLYNTTEGEKFDKKVSRKDYDTFITDGR